MLAGFIGFVLVVLLICLIWWAISTFWKWLGKGQPVHDSDTEDELSPEVKAAEADLMRLHLAREELCLETGKRHARLPKELRKQRRADEIIIREDYLNGLKIGWYQIVMIFFIGSVLGLVLEEVWMFITEGLTEHRYGLVFGPFSPLYGVGALLLTIITFQLRKHHAKGIVVFIVSMIVGGLLEQITGWSMETFMGAVSWDYIAGGVPGAITKWVAIPFLFFWGALGYAWYKLIMPNLLWKLGKPTTKRKAVFITLLSIYLIVDIALTIACFERRAQRDEGIPPQNAFQEWVDEHFSNEFMSQRFQNMVIEDTGEAIDSLT